MGMLFSAWQATAQALVHYRGNRYSLPPELAGIVGTNEAARLIERAVRVPNAKLTIKAGSVTRRLVKSAVLRNLDKLTRAQWGLVRGADAVEYYEAMAKRFPPSKEPEGAVDADLGGGGRVRVSGSSYRGSDVYERKSARLYYVLGLLAAKRQDDALRVATDEEVDLQGMAQRQQAQRPGPRHLDVQFDRPGRRFEEPQQHRGEGALPRTGHPGKDGDFAFRNT